MQHKKWMQHPLFLRAVADFYKSVKKRSKICVSFNSPGFLAVDIIVALIISSIINSNSYMRAIFAQIIAEIFCEP